MTNYDVIIVGAGSVGVPTAMACGNEGLKTLLIEKRPSVGQGDNKHAIGGIRATHSQKAKIWTSLRSIQIFGTWEKKYGDDIEWIQGGYTFVSYSQEHEKMLQDTVRLQKTYGLNIDYVNTEKIQELVPGINPNALRGGTFSPEDGNASPLLALNAFYREAKNLGVEVKFKEAVSNILVENGVVTGIKTSKDIYYTNNIINASGGDATVIAKTIGLGIPVTPDSHPAGITEPVKYFFTPMVVDIRPKKDKFWGDSKNYYFYQNKQGQIIFCITPDPPVFGTDRREISTFLPQIAKRMVELLPRLSNIKVRRIWRGLYPMTPDGLPIVGPIEEIKGYINAVGMCGQGFMLGPGIGEVLARFLTEKLTDKDKVILEDFSLYRDFEGEEKLK